MQFLHQFDILFSLIIETDKQKYYHDNKESASVDKRHE